MTRLRFIVTSILATLGALLPWGSSKLTREDFRVEILEVQESVDSPRQFRFKALVTDIRNNKFRAVQTHPYDMIDKESVADRKREINFAVNAIIQQRIQAVNARA